MKKKAAIIFTLFAMVVSAVMVRAEASDSRVFQTDLFHVTVPEEIAAISDIEVSQDAVSFFEKLSHEDFGGFAGSIQVYQDVKDYAGIPNFRRGGEITGADGEKWDVVLVFPSDVQFDFENPESTENYGLINEAVETTILETLTPVQGGTYTPQSEVDNTGVYAETIEKLKADLAEHKDMDGLSEDGFSYIYAMIPEEEIADTIGYGYVDLTGTGYPELVIMNRNDFAVYDMFTQVDGEVKSVFSGGERDVYTLYGYEEDPYGIKRVMSGSASYTEYRMYMMDVFSNELYLQVRLVYDSETDPDHPYYVDFGVQEEEDLEPLTEEEWQDWMGRFQEVGEIELTPLAE